MTDEEYIAEKLQEYHTLFERDLEGASALANKMRASAATAYATRQAILDERYGREVVSRAALARPVVCKVLSRDRQKG